MPLSLIKDIQVDQKVSLRVFVLDVQFYPYAGGTRTRILAQDEMNTSIEIVGFDNVHAMCQQVNLGQTYVFSDVMCSTYNDKLQLKLSSFSTINTSTVEIERPKLTIQDTKTLPQDETINIYAVVQEASEEVSTNPRSGSRTRRYTIADSTDCMLVYAINGAAEELVPEGSIVSCRGKIGNNQSLVIFSPMSVVENDDLKAWWSANNNHTSNKRTKNNFTMIANITVKNIGDKVDIAGIIQSTSLGVTTTQSGNTKRTIHIVDPSCKSIEMTIFGEAAKNDYPIGTEIVCKATVSDWNKLSLMMNSNIAGFDKMPVNEYRSMSDWWQQEGKHAKIESISSSDRPRECTVTDALTNIVADERLFLSGKMNNGIFTDDTASIPVQCHPSFTTDISTFQGAVSIRNAYIVNGETPKLVVFRNSIKQTSGIDQFATLNTNAGATIGSATIGDVPLNNNVQSNDIPSLISGIPRDNSKISDDD